MRPVSSGLYMKERIREGMLIRLKPFHIALLLAAFSLPSIAHPIQNNESLVVAERHYKLGQKLYQSGHTEEAIEELYTALSKQEIFYKAQLLLGRSLLDAKRYREAAATLKEIEPPERGVVEVQQLLGTAYYEMNKLAEARKRFAYAIALSKRPNYELHYLLGLVKLRQGIAGGAINEAKKAMTLKSRFAPAQKLLSDAYLMKSDYAQAEAALTRYLSNIRDQAEAAEVKERIDALKSLNHASPENSVRKTIRKPQIYSIPKPGYTVEAIRYKVEGAVKVQVLFGSDGTVKYTLLVHGIGFGLDERALKAARRIKFKPGEADGKPTSMWVGVHILFVLVKIEAEQEEGPKIALTTAHLDRLKE